MLEKLSHHDPYDFIHTYSSEMHDFDEVTSAGYVDVNTLGTARLLDLLVNESNNVTKFVSQVFPDFRPWHAAAIPF